MGLSAKKKRYIVPIIAIVAFALIIGASFAWFGFRHVEEQDFTIATVALTTNIDIQENMSGIQVGDTIVDTITFAKTAEAKNCYVRVSFNFYSDSTLSQEQKSYLLALNYDPVTPFSNATYKWLKQDNYYYLVNANNTMREVTNTSTYTFAGATTFKGVLGSFFPSTYAISNLKLKVEIQAIQSSNLPSTDLASMQGYFNETFGVTATSGYIIYYVGNDGTDTMASTIFGANQKLTRPTDPIRLGYTFGGWYTDSNLTSAYNFNNIVNKSFILYAKWS